MESSYGIGVKNRYELFYDDESDPLDAPKKSKVKKKKDKTAEKENKKIQKINEGNESTEKPRVPPMQANGELTKEEKKDITEKKLHGERVKFADKEERNNRNEFRDNAPARFSGEKRERDNRDRDNRDRTRFNGTTEFSRGRGRGRGRGNWSENRGKREYDRQSGMVTSGVKAMDKKNGAGSYNWGNDSIKDSWDDSKENDDPPQHDSEIGDPDKKESAKNDNSGSTWADPKEDENADSPKEEEAPKEMTLDEWKAQQKRVKPQFNVRKAGEGENSAQWKKTYVLNKKEKDDGEHDDSIEAEAIAEEKENKKKVHIAIDFQFSDPPTRGRFRGRGRGGAPSRGGRGRGRGGRFIPSRQEAPRMDDEKDFPSLG